MAETQKDAFCRVNVNEEVPSEDQRRPSLSWVLVKDLL